MAIHAQGSFEVKGWDEEPYSEMEGQSKLSRADVQYAYHGDLEGTGTITYLMCYSSNNIVYFIGFEQVSGRLGERSGSFVFQHNGIFEGGAVQDSVSVVPGSATGELIGLVGKGFCGGDGEAIFSLDYEIA